MSFLLLVANLDTHPARRGSLPQQVQMWPVQRCSTPVCSCSSLSERALCPGQGDLPWGMAVVCPPALPKIPAPVVYLSRAAQKSRQAWKAWNLSLAIGKSSLEQSAGKPHSPAWESLGRDKTPRTARALWRVWYREAVKTLTSK